MRRTDLFIRAAVEAAGLDLRLLGGSSPPSPGELPHLVMAVPHTGHFDTVAVIWALLRGGYDPSRLGVVAKQSYWQSSHRRLLLWTMVGKSFLLDTDSIKGLPLLIEAMRESQSELDAVIVYPQGTRDPELKTEVFAASFGLSTKLGFPILPVALLGLENVWPPGTSLLSALVRGRQRECAGGRPIARVAIGSLIPPSNEDSRQVRNQIRREYLKAIIKIYLANGEPPPPFLKDNT